MNIPSWLSDSADMLRTYIGNNYWTAHDLCNLLTASNDAEAKIVERTGINIFTTKQINDQIMVYRRQKSLWEKPKKPKLKIWWNQWAFDKIEEWRVIILNDGTIAICIQKWDMLNARNRFVFDDHQQNKEIKDMKIGEEFCEKAEITLDYDFMMDKEYEISYKFFLPVDFPIIDNRLVTWQIKQTARNTATPNPVICQRLRDWIFFTTLNNSWDITWNWTNQILCQRLAKNVVGRWVNIRYKMKFSETDWYIISMQDWEKIWEYYGKVSSSWGEFPVWHYYWADFFYKFWLYRDNFKKRLKELYYEESLILHEWNLDPDKKQRLKKIEDEIFKLHKAILQEKWWSPMTIYMKEFEVKEILG